MSQAKKRHSIHLWLGVALAGCVGLGACGSEDRPPEPPAAGSAGAATAGTGGNLSGAGGSTSNVAGAGGSAAHSAGMSGAGAMGGAAASGGVAAAGGAPSAGTGGVTAGMGGSSGEMTTAGAGGVNAGSGGISAGSGGISAGSGGTGGELDPVCPYTPGAEPSGQNWVNGELVEFNDNGGWCWYQDERVIVDREAGQLIIGSVASGGTRDRRVEVTPGISQPSRVNATTSLP